MFVNEYLSQTRVIMNTITTYIAISIILNYMPVIVKGANRQLSNNLWNDLERLYYSDSVGLQKLFDLPDDVLNGLKLVKMTGHISVDSAMLMSIEQQIEQVVLKCWVTLSGYEEITAKCISDMLLCCLYW